MTDPDDIVSLAANGMPVRDIAAARGLAETEVRKIIDQEAACCFEGAHLRREFLLETTRLRELGQKYSAVR